jgi:HD-GYP domain-containing protein (c-di-GMP phosphodiesterase class II)
MTKEAALKVLQEGAGKEWDPRLVKIFVSIIQKEGNKSKSSS